MWRFFYGKEENMNFEKIIEKEGYPSNIINVYNIFLLLISFPLKLLYISPAKTPKTSFFISSLLSNSVKKS